MEKRCVWVLETKGKSYKVWTVVRYASFISKEDADAASIAMETRPFNEGAQFRVVKYVATK